MSVGIAITKEDLDQRVGTVVIQLLSAFKQVDILSGFLVPQAASAISTTFGYTIDEATTLKTAFTDLANLAAVARGTQVQATARNAFTYAGRLAGLQ